MSTLSDLAQRVEHLLLRHAELRRTHELLQQQTAQITAERDGLRNKLIAARARVDALLAKLPPDAQAAADVGAGEP